MQKEGHNETGTPAGLDRVQREKTQSPMASKNRSTALQRLSESESIDPPLSLDDNSSCCSEADLFSESTSSPTSLSGSATWHVPYSESPIERRVFHHIEQPCLPILDLPPCLNNEETWHLLNDAASTPPVTAETLKELDLQWIQNNINLRVDVHYDYDLHFMPISGRRGEEKRMEAQKFWRALEVEMRIYQHNRFGPCANCSQQPTGSASSTFNQRLPIMFNKLKALLLILVPNNDHQCVSDALDVELLMQEVRNGILDVVKLSMWLRDLLTTHCAPIRDDWAQDMVSKISEGVQQNDMSSLVAGLEKLFSFCEAMKLDVANHQIRTFRLPLIENGVEFQRDFFHTRIRLGKLDPGPSRLWYTSIYQNCLRQGPIKFEYAVIVRAFVWLATQAQAEVPELLKYDYSRICQLREEVSDLAHLELCCNCLSIHQQRDQLLMRTFKIRLLDLTDGECNQAAGSNAIWDAHLDAISTEVTRAVHAGSDPSACQISAAAFTRYHSHLSTRFEQIDSPLHGLAAELQRRVLRHVSIFKQLSALQISELQQQHQQSRQNAAPGRHVPDVEDIARRLAHMVVIHWRVWRELYDSADDSVPA